MMPQPQNCNFGSLRPQILQFFAEVSHNKDPLLRLPPTPTHLPLPPNELRFAAKTYSLGICSLKMITTSKFIDKIFFQIEKYRS